MPLGGSPYVRFGRHGHRNLYWRFSSLDGWPPQEQPRLRQPFCDLPAQTAEQRQLDRLLHTPLGSARGRPFLCASTVFTSVCIGRPNRNRAPFSLLSPSRASATPHRRGGLCVDWVGWEDTWPAADHRLGYDYDEQGGRQTSDPAVNRAETHARPTLVCEIRYAGPA